MNFVQKFKAINNRLDCFTHDGLNKFYFDIQVSTIIVQID